MFTSSIRKGLRDAVGIDGTHRIIQPILRTTLCDKRKREKAGRTNTEMRAEGMVIVVGSLSKVGKMSGGYDEDIVDAHEGPRWLDAVGAVED
jgi:hypothetical protein